MMVPQGLREPPGEVRGELGGEDEDQRPGGGEGDARRRHPARGVPLGGGRAGERRGDGGPGGAGPPAGPVERGRDDADGEGEEDGTPGVPEGQVAEGGDGGAGRDGAGKPAAQQQQGGADEQQGQCPGVELDPVPHRGEARSGDLDHGHREGEEGGGGPAALGRGRSLRRGGTHRVGPRS
ncbi:hypothetical protein ACQ7DA_00555 [Zafaria sp. J156]|uniref:hypothetical protein n=1 Tax=Zafaria sp. J156 TaxID=3116490 RepID=UPI002E79BC91|nr:hypothetical protein [Zafaria sp. J156]MEE1619876.1 hypothetical protein [Zafaria sp. J156]